MAEEKKLKEMLKMSMKLTPQEMKDYETVKLDGERKEFLENAINQVLEDDEVKRLLYMTNLFLAFNEDMTYSDSQLENLSKVCDDISYLIEGKDMAVEFDKMSGLNHCLKLLKSAYSSIQWRVADILAECLLNNPKCQKSVLDNDGMGSLLHVLKTSDVDIVKVKCVYALSALVGNFEEAEKLFIKLNGVEEMLDIIQHEQNGDKIQIKALFLLQKLIFSESKSVDFIHIAKELISVLQKPHRNLHEFVLNILTEVVTNNPESKEKIFSSKKDAIELLEEQKSELLKKDSDEKYLDDILKYNDLIKLLE